MTLAVLIFIVGICLIYIKNKAKHVEINEKTKKVTVLLSKLLLFAPLIGVVVFSILLTTFLRGRLFERSSHALIVFVLWIYATSFYVEILKYIKNKFIMIFSIIGSVVSVMFAILLTPLNRYNTLLYSHIHGFAFLLGFCILALFYMEFLTAKKSSIQN